MRKLLVFFGSIMLIGVCVPAVSRAACDSECQIRAAGVGERAANNLMLPEFASGGKLGRLIRAEAGLEACGSKGKSGAVGTLRKARLNEIVERRLKNQPIGSNSDSEEEQGIQFSSFLSTIKALELGYALGYQEAAASATSLSESTKNVWCRAYTALGDKVLFGD